MPLPLQVTFRHMEPSPALEARILELAERLTKLCDRVTHCHVTVEKPHRHQQQGTLFEVRMDISVPGRQIAIRRAHQADASHEDPYVALRDAFRAARRRLREYEREQHGRPALRAGQGTS